MFAGEWSIGVMEWCTEFITPLLHAEFYFPSIQQFTQRLCSPTRCRTSRRLHENGLPSISVSLLSKMHECVLPTSPRNDGSSLYSSTPL